MRLLTFAVGFALLTATVFGQGERDPGAINGIVTDPVGAIFASAPVQAKNVETSTVYKTISSATGSYSLKDLPAGKYDLTVNVAGLNPFERKNVAVAVAKTEQLDIHLTETTQLSTLGEDAAGFAADARRHDPPGGPTPRVADGKPDLSGTWWGPRTVEPGKPEWLPAAEATTKQRNDTFRKDAPQARCLPSAVLRIGNVYALVQSPKLLVEISEGDDPGYHQVYLDGRAHPKDPMPQWYGHSVGHWEGDTLVVDRVGFNAESWLDQVSHPISEKLHIVERYKRVDMGHLETEITVEDPGTLVKPWTMKTVSDLAPTEDIFEYICAENNRDPAHMVGK